MTHPLPADILCRVANVKTTTSKTHLVIAGELVHLISHHCVLLLCVLDTLSALLMQTDYQTMSQRDVM